MLEKAPEAFRTISEAAVELDVPQHVLRFWESRFTQVKPMKRGGGRRFYRRSDLDLLKGIRRLLYGEGYTIRGVQRILREEGVAHVASIGRGETVARKRDARDLELDGVPKPGSAVPAPRISRTAPPPGLAPLARPADASEAQVRVGASETPEPVGPPRLADAQLQSLKLALAELESARKLLDTGES
jgi:DNA-binding transcriptional MerR regulator